MLKYLTYDIVFQEFPDEVTLAINLSCCPNHCKGCHSAILCEDVGTLLDENAFFSLIEKYDGGITCVALMGGDNDPLMVSRLLLAVKERYKGRLKTGWYSGKPQLPENITLEAFDYIKLGPYKEECGAIKEKTTNQRFYKVEDNTLKDLTYKFWKQ